MPYQPQLNEEILALENILPMPKQWAGSSEQLWNQLEVRREKIEPELQIREMVCKYIGEIPQSFLKVVALRCELNPTASGGLESELIGAVADEYMGMIDKAWLKDIFFLNAFVQNKHHAPIRRAAEAIIGKERMASCDSYFKGDQDAIRLALCSVAYFQNPANLTLIYIYERAERFGYTRYKLVSLDSDSGQVPLEADINRVDTQQVEKALKEVDQLTGQRVPSSCVGIYPEDQRITVFVKRQFRPDKIPEADRTVFGDRADPIVLRFSNRMLQLEERSEQRIAKMPAGKRIADQIAGSIFCRRVQYEEIVSRTHIDRLKSFLSILGANEDDRLELVELVLPQAPIYGQPQLSLKGSADALRKSLGALAEKGFTLLQPALIGRLVVNFRWNRPTPGKENAAHQFTLHLLRFDDQHFTVKYSGGTGTDERDAFEKYLEKQYEIIASPKTGRGK